MQEWECYRCSYVVKADSPPDECPSCHYSLAFWLEHVESKPPSTVKDYVRGKILKLDGNESGLEAARLMKDNDAGSVIVTSGGKPIGIVTERDILQKIAAADLQASSVLLKEIMTYPIISVSSVASIMDAIKLMAKHHIRRLLVTENEKPIGMLSQRSILAGSFRLASSSPENE